MHQTNANVDRWIDRIKDAYQNRDLIVAENLAQQAIDETNQSARILEIAGMIAYERQNYDEAVKLIESAMFEIRLSFASQLVLAKAWLKIGKQESAETTLVFLVEMIEQIPCPMLPDLTNALAELKRYDHALTVCRTAFARHPDDDHAIFGAAFYMHRLGYPLELVKSVVSKAIALNPNSQLYRANLAAVCCALEQWDEAYAEACRLSDKAIKSLPCKCILSQLRQLFARFEDYRRLQLIRTA